MNEIPFIKLFRTVKACYIFDVNTTSIIRIDRDIYLELERLVSGIITYEQLSNVSQDKVNKLKKQGFLEPCKLDLEIKHAVADQIENYIQNNVHQLILQVTQNCNLRCK